LFYFVKQLMVTYYSQHNKAYGVKDFEISSPFLQTVYCCECLHIVLIGLIKALDLRWNM